MNQNRGFKILLRLRPHEAQDTFYDQDQLVLVMLHEASPSLPYPEIVSLELHPKPEFELQAEYRLGS